MPQIQTVGQKIKFLIRAAGGFLCLIFVGLQDSSAQSVFHIQVDAGIYARQHTVVQFQFPEDIAEGSYTLTRSEGTAVALQIDHQNRGWFILDALSAGTSAIFTLDYTAQRHTEATSRVVPAEQTVQLHKDGATLTLSSGGTPVLSYYLAPNSPPEGLDERYRRGGYIHPVYSPSGSILTNHLNVEQHPHHAGIWSAWTRTVFDGNRPDFWNVHQNTGRVDVDSLLHAWDGPVTGGFVSRHQFKDLTGSDPVVALNELWEVRVFAASEQQSVRYFDLTVTQTANTDKPLFLPEYHYGGVGFRGNKSWDDPSMVQFLTAEGLGRDGHAARTRWVHIGGNIGEAQAGIAILGYPANHRFPQTVRIHPSEPFFNFAPTQLGDMAIHPGVPYVTKLRFITMDGTPDTNLIEQIWRDFAYPPGVTVRKKLE